jgi:hypothetical protein
MLSSKETIRIYKYNGISINIKQMHGQREIRKKKEEKSKKKNQNQARIQTKKPPLTKLVVSAVVDLQLSRSQIIVHYSN